MNSWQRFLSHSVSCRFTLVTASCVLNLIRFHLSTLAVISWATGVLCRKPSSWSLFLLKFRSLKSYIKAIDPFWIDFYMGWEIGITCGPLVSSEPEEAAFSPTSVLTSLLRMGCCDCRFISASSIVFYLSTCLFLNCSRISCMRILYLNHPHFYPSNSSHQFSLPTSRSLSF